MSKPITVIEVDSGEGQDAASLAKRVALGANKAREEAQALSNFFANLANDGGSTIRVRVDSATSATASIQVAVSGALIDADESFGITSPQGVWILSAIDSGAVTGSGQFDVHSTNSGSALSMATAINTLNGLKSLVTASVSTDGSDAWLNVYARNAGIAGNSLFLSNNCGLGLSGSGLFSGSGYFSGGVDAVQRLSASVTFVAANIDEDDTLKIGSVTLTARNSASNDNQFTISGSTNAQVAQNAANAIAAQSALTGIVSGSVSSNVVTLYYSCDPRVAQHIVLQTSDADGIVVTQPTADTTFSNQQATRTYVLGGADSE